MAASPVELEVPGDKSITHRALIFSALADGESRLSGLLDAADTRSTAAALRALGAAIPEGPLGTLTVRGRGPAHLIAPAQVLDCGNSGTTARLFLGLLAGCPFQAEVTGDDSLRRRPMRRVTRPLADCGARFEELGEEDRLPIRVHGARPLDAIDHVDPRSSAQVRTAMVLAGLSGGRGARVAQPRRSRDHTERILRAMGAPIEMRAGADGLIVSLEPAGELEPLDMNVPGDFSSAAYFLALGALGGAVRVRRVGLNPTRTGMLDVLRRMGVEVHTEATSEEAGEPVGSVSVAGSTLEATTIGADEVPTLLDEIPVLAVLAATAAGETRFEGVAELRVKESDRVHALVENLSALEIEAEAGPDHLVVRGTRRPLRGAVEAFGDHRIAMAFGVLAALPDNEISIRGREAVRISYPTYWKELERVKNRLEAQ